jgi:hypothetical protein
MVIWESSMRLALAPLEHLVKLQGAGCGDRWEWDGGARRLVLSDTGSGVDCAGSGGDFRFSWGTTVCAEAKGHG